MTATARPSLSRDVIARAALDLIDESGLGELSMRKLGHQLGVEAMSLYHYVTNKDDLLDAVLDGLYAEVDLPRDTAEQDWETALRLGLRSFRDVLVRHQAALELFSRRPAKSKEAFDVLLWSVSRFTQVGLDSAQAHHAFHFAVSFVMGHVATELGTLSLIRNGKGIDPDEVDDPIVRAFILESRVITSDDMFDAGLDAVVAGLRAAYRLP